MTTEAKFAEPLPGTTMRLGTQTVKILATLDADTVMVADVVTERKHIAPLQELRVIARAAYILNEPPLERHVHPEEDAAGFSVAAHRLAVIKPLLDNPNRNMAVVTARAKEFGVHWTTLFEWIRFYQDTGLLSSLIPRKRGPQKGLRRISEEQEAIVENAIRKKALSSQRHKVSEVCKLVARHCHAAGIKAPHPNTIRARIDEIHPKELLRQRGRRDAARDRYQAIRGQFPATNHPLEIVQMDHTKADIILLDDSRLIPLGRPFVTVAIDVHTRMIAGLVVQFEAPGAATAGTCVSMSILPKDDLLRAASVEGTWPVRGKIGTLHMDNAREFKGEVLRNACAEWGIDLQLRPIKTPHYGGHIERYMGTLASVIRNLSGATFSDVRERKGYDSEKNAAMTLAEFESWLIDWVVNVYHKMPHSALGIPPEQAWRDAWSTSPDDGKPKVPQTIANPDKLRLDFLPFFQRTIQRYGVVLDDLHYWDEILAPHINATETPRSKEKVKFLFRRDPRHLKNIWFFDPTTRLYREIPMRDIRRPDVSVWEWRAAQKHLRDERAVHRDENAIFEAMKRLQTREEEAARNTKAARRRSRQSITSAALPDRESPHLVAVIAPPDRGDDIFAEPVTPFGMDETSSP